MLTTVAGMREILLTQTRHIDACLYLLIEDEHGRSPLPAGDPDINRVIKALMHMIGISAHSLVKLTDEVGLSAKDGYPIARAIIEGAVNVAYLMASEPEVSRKAQRHAEVRAFRDLSRQGEMGGCTFQVQYQGQIPAVELQRLEAMAAEFSTEKGREKDWTDLSLRQRLDAAAAAFPHNALISLNVSAFSIYRHASEVMHGSYYGALKIWGLTSPRSGPIDDDAFRLVFVDHQFSTLMSAIFAFAGVVECFALYAGVPNLKVGVDDVLRRLSKLPAVAETLTDQASAGQSSDFE
jgi:hypothetical protein